MRTTPELLGTIRVDPRLATVLAHSFEFDVGRGERRNEARLWSARALEPIAGDFSGGTYYLCGDPQVERPVLYVSSEGEAGLLADSLVEALEILVGIPYWHDCLGFSGGGDLEVMKRTAAHSRADLASKNSDMAANQSLAANILSLDISDPEVLLTRLHAAAARSAPEYVFTDETGEYEGLFGPFQPERNPHWR